MADSSLFDDILQDVGELVKQEAHKARRTLALSPEVVAALESVRAPSSVDEQSSAGGLAEVAEEVAQCGKCGLAQTRTQTVFGDGSPTAELVFVGEAPGFYEDQQGKPFVGKAGQLLTDIIVKGMKTDRGDVYICNVLKCRPPENRDPKPDEVEQCEPFLVRQLDVLKPKVICALGGHAAKTLLKTTESTGALRGKWHFYHGIPLRVTYHPAYLLRNPEDKRKTWEDIQHIMKLLSGEEQAEAGPTSLTVGNPGAG
jgi:DNA polymerase